MPDRTLNPIPRGLPNFAGTQRPMSFVLLLQCFSYLTYGFFLPQSQGCYSRVPIRSMYGRHLTNVVLLSGTKHPSPCSCVLRPLIVIRRCPMLLNSMARHTAKLRSALSLTLCTHPMTASTMSSPWLCLFCPPCSALVSERLSRTKPYPGVLVQPLCHEDGQCTLNIDPHAALFPDDIRVQPVYMTYEQSQLSKMALEQDSEYV